MGGGGKRSDGLERRRRGGGEEGFGAQGLLTDCCGGPVICSSMLSSS